MAISPVLRTFGQPTDVCTKQYQLSITFSHDGNIQIGAVGTDDPIAFAAGIGNAITIRQPVLVCC